MSVFAVPDGQNAEDDSLTPLKDLELRWSEATSEFTFNIVHLQMKLRYGDPETCWHMFGLYTQLK